MQIIYNTHKSLYDYLRGDHMEENKNTRSIIGFGIFGIVAFVLIMILYYISGLWQ